MSLPTPSEKRRFSRRSLMIVASLFAILGIYLVLQSFATTTITIVDDSTIGTTTNQFEFVGSWTNWTDANSYGGAEHYAATTDAYYQVRFSGTQIKIYTTLDPNRGIAGISIDGGAEAMVDNYSVNHSSGVLNYTSPMLADAAHILKVRVTGNKNSASTGTYIVADRVEVSSGSIDPNPVGGTPVPSGISGTWNLKFQDEFDGSSLDLSKWRPNWLSSSDTTVTQPVNDTEDLCFDPRNLSVGSGLLTIKAEKRSCTASNGKTYTYASGLIESYHDYNYTYGVAEARIWIPQAPEGTTPVNWPNFWTNGAPPWPTNGEDDIMEVLAGRTCYTYHYSGGELTNNHSNCPNLKSGWHTFASNWQPNSVTYYYDGVQVGSYTVSISSPHFLVASLQLGGTTVTATNVIVPSQMQIDYVRVWQQGTTPTPLQGDLDNDTHVTGHDLSLLLSKFNTTYAPYDLDGTPPVSAHDLSILLGNYGK